MRQPCPQRGRDLQVSPLPLLALPTVAEPFVRADRTSVVTDEILIHAPPARVWPQITAFPAIPQPPRLWLSLFCKAAGPGGCRARLAQRITRTPGLTGFTVAEWND